LHHGIKIDIFFFTSPHRRQRSGAELTNAVGECSGAELPHTARGSPNWRKRRGTTPNKRKRRSTALDRRKRRRPS
jgi:hypothetical protein